MKGIGETRAVLLFFAGILLAPSGASAMADVHALIESIKESASSGAGTVVETNVSASSNTGGYTQVNGGTVTTGGSSASSRVETHINANSETGGTVKIDIRTEENGTVHEEHREEVMAPGEAVRVNVSVPASSSVAPTIEGIKKEVEEKARAAIESQKVIDDTSTTTAAAQEEDEQKKDIESFKWILGFSNNIGTFVAKVFSIFSLW
jgi:hypothetical protein